MNLRIRRKPRMRLRLLVYAAVLLSGFGCSSDSPYGALPSEGSVLLTTPALPGSAALEKETRTIIQMQTAPDKEELRQADSERDLDPEMIATEVDVALIRGDYPMLFALLDRAGKTTGHAIGNAKKHWHTTRPYLANATIRPLIEAHDSYAYPSGHTVLGHVWAAILGMVLPDKKEDFRHQAEEIAQHRVLVGLHYPQDLRGGHELALLVLGHLLAQPEFMHDLALARGEAQRNKEDIR